jgi:large subunit ribosomal protein L29
MKKKDIQEFKNKQDGELERIVKDKNEELRVLRFDLAAGKVKDISKIRDARKTVARAKTILHERQASK